MTEAGNRPAMGETPTGFPRGGEDAQAEETTGILDRVTRMASNAVSSVRAWLYEGVETNTAQSITGFLVKVEIGLQNDDYAEITSGLSEGDVVLYTASESSSSTSMFGGMNMFGGMGGGAPSNMGSRQR